MRSTPVFVVPTSPRLTAFVTEIERFPEVDGHLHPLPKQFKSLPRRMDEILAQHGVSPVPLVGEPCVDISPICDTSDMTCGCSVCRGVLVERVKAIDPAWSAYTGISNFPANADRGRFAVEACIGKRTG